VGMRKIVKRKAGMRRVEKGKAESQEMYQKEILRRDKRR